MKTYKISLKLTFIFISVLIIALTSCEKNNTEDYTWELSLDDDLNIITESNQGIEFTFCLLNEEGIPSKIFNEGENFYINFVVENKRSSNLYFDPSFFIFDNTTDAFCRIININGDTIGKPFEYLGTDQIGAPGYIFDSENKYEFKFPWLYNYDEWTSLFCEAPNNRWEIYYSSIVPSYQEPLLKGIYYTQFSHQFNFIDAEYLENITTNQLSFGINFRIK